MRSAKFLSRSGGGRVPIRGQTTSRNMHEHIRVSHPARGIPRTMRSRIWRLLHMWVIPVIPLTCVSYTWHYKSAKYRVKFALSQDADSFREEDNPNIGSLTSAIHCKNLQIYRAKFFFSLLHSLNMYLYKTILCLN